MGELTPRHEEQGHRGAFFLEKEGARLAQMTYTRSSAGLILIDHTEVSDALRGQGAGKELLDALVAWARQTKTKVLPVCPYAKAQFEKHAALRDVLSA
ncbi:MAG: N-acetyltransferase [Myxococcales bacterium]|nr:N-acetyltransferase [Myxococcales bacterium]